MLIALQRTLELIATLPPVHAALKRRAPSLADQLERAVDSVALNLGEARGRSGRDKRARFRIAAGEAQEVKAALAVARAWRHVADELLARPCALADEVAAMTYCLAYR